MTFAADLVSRRADLSAGLEGVEERIARACIAAGRARTDVHLIVVTKFFPATDIELLGGLGVTDIGESRDQEASAKIATLPPEVRTLLRVHFIGQLQTNKAGSVATYADSVHSIDRERLVGALERAATAHGRQIGVLIQVNLGLSAPGAAADSRGGVSPEGIGALASSIAAAPHLDLLGLMAVAPQPADPGEAFGLLSRCADDLRAVHPHATWISAGMSGDLESAVANGATHLRVGSAILGSRPVLR